MIWLWMLYFVAGIGVYVLMAKAVENETGQAPQIGCLFWLFLVVI
jgi:hypothetical protein